MFDLYKYHIPIKREILLAIIYLAVFGQIYCTKKKRERKKKKKYSIL
jgi:hypothetical protein